MTTDSFQVKITWKDIEYRFKEIEKSQLKNHEDSKTILHEILEQAKLTNGRVTSIEKKSFGVWVHKYPFKFAAIITSIVLLLLFSIYTSSRTEAITAIIGLLI